MHMPLVEFRGNPVSSFLFLSIYVSPTADIGKPDFKVEVSEDKKVTTLYVKDPLSALFKDGNQLNLREIFGDQLQYKVIYRKKKSTGKVITRRHLSIGLKHKA